ncbi:MAG: AHH domain-containing protein [Pseudomonadota bacterium]
MALDSAASVSGGSEVGTAGGTSGDDKTSDVAAETKASFSSAVDEGSDGKSAADVGLVAANDNLGVQMEKARDFDAVQGRNIQLAQATTGVVTDALPTPGAGRPGVGTIPRGLGPAAAAAMAAELLTAIDDRRERAAVDGALANPELGLNPALPEDVLAARAYVWSKNFAPINYRDVPWSGTGNEQAARSIMQLEQAVPGTLGSAMQGDATSRRMLDEAVAGALAGNTTERRSDVDPALSTYSTRARAIAAATAGGMQNWQAHHLIPFETMQSLPVPLQMQIAASGWRMDSPGNLMALPGDEASFYGPPNNEALPMHRGSHPVYSARASGQFAGLIANFDRMSPAEIRAEMARIELTMQGEILAGMHHDRIH